MSNGIGGVHHAIFLQVALKITGVFLRKGTQIKVTGGIISTNFFANQNIIHSIIYKHYFYKNNEVYFRIIIFYKPKFYFFKRIFIAKHDEKQVKQSKFYFIKICNFYLRNCKFIKTFF